jgi:hypothetical protein
MSEGARFFAGPRGWGPVSAASTSGSAIPLLRSTRPPSTAGGTLRPVQPPELEEILSIFKQRRFVCQAAADLGGLARGDAGHAHA